MERVLLLLLLLLGADFHGVYGFTDARDATALRSLKDNWQNLPPSWTKSGDPCGDQWDGITCNKSRIVSMRLSTMGIKGSLSGDIGGLDQLQTLDLSYNPGITGSLTPTIGNLKNLNILILLGCSFTGRLPDELGNLSQLTYMALNSNNFTGVIPSSLGKLSKLYWLDLAENQLTGNIPVSPGLDQLLNAKHFHLNKNRLSGFIPRRLFNSSMELIHILFDGNNFTGIIPDTVGLVQSLEVLRLDRNNFNGSIPDTINNLTNLNELHLAGNKLTGIIPDLSRLGVLNFLDLSGNSFEPSVAPDWLSTLQTLTTLVMDNAELTGTVPKEIFSFPQIQQVRLSNNKFNGTLDLGQSISSQLQLIDLQFNDISQVTVGSVPSNALQLFGNPVCSRVPNLIYCQLPKASNNDAYTTSLTNCGNKQCSTDEGLNPQSCVCAFPYEGTIFFRAPFFSDLSNISRFQSLERSLWTTLLLNPGSVFLQNPFFNLDDYLQVQVSLFPSNGKYFNRSEIQRIGFYLSNQTFKPPPEFGPYYFIASPYTFPGIGKSSFSTVTIAGIVVGGAILLLVLVLVGIYAIRQKKRAERAIELSKPFASWAPGGKDIDGVPQLKGARWFSYDELKKVTSNFSENNEIGSGGYGKVYKGMLSNGQPVAIKRSQQGSMQGGLEFKTEIELLSRVHHKNLVSLVGFCFEQGEQILVYEYISNGTLRESLSGKSGINLDWKRRLRIALGSARGLAYLHELAHPPIIHRDVKSANILLDENLTAKVADFGLSKLVLDGEKSHVSTQVKGTLGYLDPEYYMTQRLTEKSDVYSFGVVMLELITARQPIEKGKYIVREVKTAMNNSSEHYGLKELMDNRIRNGTNLVGFRRFLELAMQCVQDSASDRPTMSDLVKEIETLLQNEGMQTNSTSAASSATEFGSTKGPGAPRHPYNDPFPNTSASSSATEFGSTKGPGAPRHPYNDPLPRKEENSSGAFEYSGGYSLSVEPK